MALAAAKRANVSASKAIEILIVVTTNVLVYEEGRGRLILLY